MNEINDALLNEYLDDTLAEETRQAVEAHLANSPEARERLAALAALFATLSALEDVPLTADLSERVLTAVHAETEPAPAPAPAWLRLLPLIQILGAIVLVVVFWSAIQTWWDNGRHTLNNLIATIQLPEIMLWQTLQTWGTAVWENNQIAPPQFDLASGQWAILLALALVAWLLSNRLLFTSPNGGSYG